MGITFIPALPSPQVGHEGPPRSGFKDYASESIWNISSEKTGTIAFVQHVPFLPSLGPTTLVLGALSMQGG